MKPGPTGKAPPPALPPSNVHPPNQKFQYPKKDYGKVSLAPWNCVRSNWALKAPFLTAPLTLLPRSFTSTTNVLTTGKYQGKPYDWVVRNDINYCEFLMKKELEDGLGSELSIFAHYCLEIPHLAQLVTTKEITKMGGVNNMVTTTFTGYGRAMRTGRATVSHFALTAKDILQAPQTFKGYTIDPQMLRKTIKLIRDGELSLDEISWLWEDGTHIVTPKQEVFYIWHQH